MYTIKKILLKIDQVVFMQKFVQFYNKRKEKMQLFEMVSSYPLSFSVYYTNANSLLTDLFDKYGSDKGSKTKSLAYRWPSHTYSDFYSRQFGGSRFVITSVYENGIGSNDPSVPSNMGFNAKPGASLRALRDYFPNAMVFGSDIDAKALITEDRIVSYQMDQLDPNSILGFWKKVGQSNFDLMIDDGLHTFQAGISLFENSINRLATNGLYIIEDVQIRDLKSWRKYFAESPYLCDFIRLNRVKKKLDDNNLLVIRKMS